MHREKNNLIWKSQLLFMPIIEVWQAFNYSYETKHLYILHARRLTAKF